MDFQNNDGIGQCKPAVVNNPNQSHCAKEPATLVLKLCLWSEVETTAPRHNLAQTSEYFPSSDSLSALLVKRC